MAMSIMVKKARLFKPEAPKVFVRTNLPECAISFVDFLPGLIRLPNSGIITVELLKEIEFHNFRVLIETANKWLKRHLEWEAITCETITLMHKNSSENYDLNSEDTCFFDLSFQSKYYLKSLRIWIKRRSSKCKTENCQILNYIDVTPEKLNPGSFMKPNFEKKEDLLRRINEYIKNEEINGRILTIETVAYEATTDWKIDPELTLTPISIKYVYMFRVFFDCSSTSEGEVDVEDFVPEKISKGSIFSRPKFESMPELVNRAEKWIANCPFGRFLNAKSLLVALKSNVPDLSATYISFPGDFLKIYRVFYIKYRSKVMNVNVYPTSSLYIPNDKKESVADFAKRIDDSYQRFMNEDANTSNNSNTGMVCAETICINCRSSVEEVKKDALKTFFRCRIEMKSGFVYFVHRISSDLGAQKWNYIQCNQ